MLLQRRQWEHTIFSSMKILQQGRKHHQKQQHRPRRSSMTMLLFIKSWILPFVVVVALWFLCFRVSQQSMVSSELLPRTVTSITNSIEWQVSCDNVTRGNQLGITVFLSAETLKYRINELRFSKEGKDLVRIIEAQQLKVFNHSGPLSVESRLDLALLAASINAHVVLETGFGAATSTSGFFASFAVSTKNTTERGTIHSIDPWQSRDYNNMGLQNLEATLKGLQTEAPWMDPLPQHILHRNTMAITLPELYAQGFCVPVFYMDAGHKFDENIVEVYYANSMLPVGGLLIMDDSSWMPSKKTTEAYILTNLPFVRITGLFYRGSVLLKVRPDDKRKFDYHVHFESFK